MKSCSLILGAVAVFSSGVAAISLYKLYCARKLYSSKAKRELLVAQQLHVAFANQQDLDQSPNLSEAISSLALRFEEYIVVLCTQECIGKPELEKRVLDIPCGAGGLTFRLTRHFAQVVGIEPDQSLRFAALQLQQQGKVLYSLARDRDDLRVFVANLPFHLDKNRVTIIDENPESLPSSIGSFGCVVVKLSPDFDSKALLYDLHHFVLPNGIVVIVNGQHSFESAQQWGSSIPAKEVDRILSSHFDYLLEKSKKGLPSAYPLSLNVWQVCLNDLQVWRRKPQPLSS